MAELECPKCGNPWRTLERSGLMVDQCTGCRGVFLDRGELERLIDAENAYYERFPGGGAERRDHDDDDDRHERHERHEPRRSGIEQLGGLGALLGAAQGGGHKHGSGHGKRHKRESFLSELLG